MLTWMDKLPSTKCFPFFLVKFFNTVFWCRQYSLECLRDRNRSDGWEDSWSKFGSPCRQCGRNYACIRNFILNFNVFLFFYSVLLSRIECICFERGFHLWLIDGQRVSRSLHRRCDGRNIRAGGDGVPVLGQPGAAGWRRLPRPPFWSLLNHSDKGSLEMAPFFFGDRYFLPFFIIFFFR